MFLAAISSLALAASGLFPADLPVILDGLKLPRQTQQLLVVSSEGWEKTSGQMQCFVRGKNGWQPAGEAFSILVGGKGMGWGAGLHQPVPSGPQKMEGDRRAPAGIFSLGTAFGYAAAPPAGTSWAYQASTAQDYFVDDSTSPEYNHWVRLTEGADPTERWASFERMRRKDGRYEFGVVVNHNSDPASPGRGSAIFLHVRHPGSQSTTGCTAMTRDQMAALIQWLQPDKQPLLIQAPRDEFSNLRLR